MNSFPSGCVISFYIPDRFSQLFLWGASRPSRSGVRRGIFEVIYIQLGQIEIHLYIRFPERVREDFQFLINKMHVVEHEVNRVRVGVGPIMLPRAPTTMLSPRVGWRFSFFQVVPPSVTP